MGLNALSRQRARQARSAVTRWWGQARHDTAEDPELVAQLRRRLRRARAAAEREKAEKERLRRELRTTRVSLRNPFPEIELPATVLAVADTVVAEQLSYLRRENLLALAAVVREADLAGREGLVIEAGTALGGSGIVMASAKAPTRTMRVYDVFGQIPSPSDRDGEDVQQRYEVIAAGAARGVGDDLYYGYRDDLLGEVTASYERLGVPLDDHRVELVRGLFQDTLEVDEPVAVAHLDGDWYDSTMTCLERIAPRLVPGGRLVLDDYYHWSGCRTAVDDYFAGRTGFQLEHRARLHVVRR
ncbi:TylF/MycF/NovP-related O-methyltransferase [Nocardioides aurantiacus]|uniref:Asparagine synthase (Glutamine-hydrolysing) n=1 Tax=Nocardioides aurantiacus TaxID=86796 RepID=A0A3N2CPK8_9ACTN|nr:TylF/MycF/NovP-related O-methyltransferase [Nocardioides aurantiacus]ROR89450.1 asparagine synthase (glutamine-hydrolysing) [Nocardioides aurantiacus]